MFAEILTNLDISVKKCSELSGIPQSTLADLAKGKTSIEKMSAGNVKKLSKCFKKSMEEMMDYCVLPEISDVDEFKKAEDEKIKEKGLSGYIAELDGANLIETCYDLNDRVRFEKYMSSLCALYSENDNNIPPKYSSLIFKYKNNVSSEIKNMLDSVNGFVHKTLEQRVLESDKPLVASKEYDFGEPMGKEYW